MEVHRVAAKSAIAAMKVIAAVIIALANHSSRLTPSVRVAARMLDIATIRRGVRPVPVLNEASGELPVGAGGKPYSDGRVPKIDPVANVPRPDLSCLREGFEARCELTDAKNPAGDGESNFAFLQTSHRTASPPRIPTWKRAICANSRWRAQRLTPSLSIKSFAMGSSSSSTIECSSTPVRLTAHPSSLGLARADAAAPLSP